MPPGQCWGRLQVLAKLPPCRSNYSIIYLRERWQNLPIVLGSKHDSSKTVAVHMVDTVEAGVAEQHPDHLHVPVLDNGPV